MISICFAEMVQVPIVGRVAAGEPILAQQNIEDYFPFPAEYVSNKQLFLLKVQGESMVNAGILNGDYVLVEEAKTAENGEKVVAMIEDGATVKTFYREEGVIRLQPENDFMDPIIVQDVVILGRVIGVMRFLNRKEAGRYQLLFLLYRSTTLLFPFSEKFIILLREFLFHPSRFFRDYRRDGFLYRIRG